MPELSQHQRILKLTVIQRPEPTQPRAQIERREGEARGRGSRTGAIWVDCGTTMKTVQMSRSTSWREAA
jgi:hypothetical protein